MNRICVIGSLNMDLVLKMQNLPKLGETLMVDDYDKIPGGKGGNQACSAARLGGKVTIIGAIGNDEYGSTLKEGLKKDGIDTSFIKKVGSSSGLAIITVDRDGNNTIAVVEGANSELTTKDIQNASEVIEHSDVLIAQFETPIEATVEAFRLGKKAECITLLNPAPYKKIPDALLRYTDIIIPNETEAYELTGIEVSDKGTGLIASKKILEAGVKKVIITMGKTGALLVSKDSCELVEGYKVNAVDTTAAGDSFIGAIASMITQAHLEKDQELISLIKYANLVASITITRLGAQSSIPTLTEVTSIGRQQTS